MNEPVGSYSPPPPPPGPPSGPSGPSEPGGNPWERRGELGFGAALLANIKEFVTAPGPAFDQTIRKGDYASPLLFAILIGWFCAIINQIWSIFLQSSMVGFLPPELQDQFGLFMATSATGFIVNLVLAPIYVLIALFLWSAILHLFVMLYGALAQSDAGFEGTFRVVSYSMVASLGGLVPVLGSLITLVWSLVLLTLGLTRIHRTTQGKAAFAAVSPLLLCCVCAGLMVMLAVAMGLSTAAFFSQVD